jgi:dienelactone hydrolase
VLHGIAASHKSCAPGLSIPLARHGLVVLAIDFPGHGRSGGSMPRASLDDLEVLQASPGNHPEVEAALDFLKAHSFVNPQQIVLVGHSRGGWAAAAFSCQQPEIGGVVVIAAAPTFCDQDKPRNLLILAGGQDELIPERQSANAIRSATGGAKEGLQAPYGWHHLGNARQLQIGDWVNHLSPLADPVTTRHTVQWVGYCFGIDYGMVPGERLLIAAYSVLAASAGGFIALIWLLKLSANRFLPSPGPPSHLVGKSRPLVLILLVLLVAPVAAWVGKVLPGTPVLFSTEAIFMLWFVAAICWLLRNVPFQSSHRPEAPAKDAGTAGFGRGLALGLLALGGTSVFVAAPWGLTWLDLLPTGCRLLLGLVLGCLCLPASWLIAGALPGLWSDGYSRLSGLRQGCCWGAMGFSLYAGYLLFARASYPLLAVPCSLLAFSFALAGPLWLIPARPGLAVARGLCHGATAAWLLACHLPFVE